MATTPAQGAAGRATTTIDRRAFITTATAVGAALAAAPLLRAASLLAAPRVGADACVLIWLGGGVAQTDTWDPKPFAPFRAGMRAKDVLCTCASIPTSAPGVSIGAGLDHIAAIMDRGCIVRSVVGGAADGPVHLAAQRRLFANMVVGASTVPVESAFDDRLAVDGYEPAPPRRRVGADNGDGHLFGRRLRTALTDVETGAPFVRVEFPYRPFDGFDTHSHGAARMVELKRQIDRPIASFVADLEHRGLLDRTLVVIASEFGRTIDGGGDEAASEAPGERIVADESMYGFHGHFAACTSVVLFGGGAPRGIVIGRTADRHPMVAVEDPVRFTATCEFAATCEHLSSGRGHRSRVRERLLRLSDAPRPLSREAGEARVRENVGLREGSIGGDADQP